MVDNWKFPCYQSLGLGLQLQDDISILYLEGT